VCIGGEQSNPCGNEKKIPSQDKGGNWTSTIPTDLPEETRHREGQKRGNSEATPEISPHSTREGRKGESPGSLWSLRKN